MPEPERRRFEHSSEQMASPMAEMEADERPTRGRVVDRSLLSEEVRQRDDSSRSWPGMCGLRIELLERKAVRKLALEPADERPRGGHASVRQVLAGNEMEVEVEPLVHERLVGGEEDVAGTSELDEQVTVPDESGSERRRDMIGRPGHDRDSGAQTGRRSGRGGDAAHHLVGPADRREQVGIDPGRSTDVGRPAIGLEVVETALERPVTLDSTLSGEPEREVVVGAEDRVGLLPESRLVAI